MILLEINLPIQIFIRRHATNKSIISKIDYMYLLQYSQEKAQGIGHVVIVCTNALIYEFINVVPATTFSGPLRTRCNNVECNVNYCWLQQCKLCSFL